MQLTKRIFCNRYFQQSAFTEYTHRLLQINKKNSPKEICVKAMNKYFTKREEPEAELPECDMRRLRKLPPQEDIYKTGENQQRQSFKVSRD